MKSYVLLYEVLNLLALTLLWIMLLYIADTYEWHTYSKVRERVEN